MPVYVGRWRKLVYVSRFLTRLKPVNTACRHKLANPVSKPSDAIWCLSEPSDTVWCLSWLFDAVWCLSKLANAVWCLLEPSDAV